MHAVADGVSPNPFSDRDYVPIFLSRVVYFALMAVGQSEAGMPYLSHHI